MSLASATTMVSTHRSLLTERCERDWAQSSPICCSLSHSSLSLSARTESLGSSKACETSLGVHVQLILAWHGGKRSLVSNHTNICSTEHIHPIIHIRTLNSTGTGRLLGLNAAFFPAAFWCNSRIDHVGLWTLVWRLLDRFNKILSLRQREEASLRK